MMFRALRHLLLEPWLWAVGIGLAAAVAWGVSPDPRLVLEVGDGGKTVELTKTARLTQLILRPTERRAVVIFRARTLPPNASVHARVSHTEEVSEGSLVLPRVRPVEGGAEILVPFERSPSGKARGIELSAPDLPDPLSIPLAADPREANAEDTLRLTRVQSARSPSVETRRPLALTHRVIEQPLRWESIPPATWRALRNGAGLVVFGVVAVLLFPPARTVLVTLVPSRALRTAVLVGGCLLIGGVLRWQVASTNWLVNDEQSYVYNAVTWNVRQPFVWKSPVLIGAEAAFLRLGGFPDVVTPRLLVVLGALAAGLFLFAIAREFAGTNAGIGAFLAWTLLPSSVAHTSLVLAEQWLPLPVFAALWSALVARRRATPPAWQLLLTGLLVCVAILTRWSAVFWFLPVLVLLVTREKHEFLRRVWLVLLPLLLILGAAFVLAPSGAQGARLARDIFFDFIEQSRGRWLSKFQGWHGVLAMFVPHLVLIGAWAATWVGSWRGLRWRGIVLAGIAGVFLLPAGRGVWEGAFPWVLPLVIGSAAVLWMIAFPLPRLEVSPWAMAAAISMLLPPAIAYSLFHKVNPAYASEFLPGLTILAGFGLARGVAALRETAVHSGVNRTRSAVAAGLLLVLVSAWFGVHRALPYAGTLELDAVRKAVQAVRETTRPGEPVLAAAVLLPLRAERPLAANIAHPAAYAPTWRGRPNPGFEARFGPLAEALAQQRIPLVVREKLFDDTYGRHAGIADALRDFYRPVAEIENGNSQPITLLLPR